MAQFAAGVGVAVIWNMPTPLLLLDLLFAAGGLTLAEVRGFEEAPPWTLFCYWLPYWVWIVSNGQPEARMATFGLLSLGFALFYLWVIWWGPWKRRPLRTPDLAVLALNGAAYFGVSYYLLDATYHDYMGLFAVTLAAAHLLAAKLLWNPEAADERVLWPALLAVSITLTFLTLAIPIQFVGFRIIAWVLEGAALAWVASRFHSGRVFIGAGIILLLAIGRLAVFDAWIYPDGKHFQALLNARFLTFAVSAAALWLAARFAPSGIFAGASYVSGHFVMLWILGLEVIGWAERSVASANLWSIETTAISILMALYSLISVAIGVVTRTLVNRILGLGVMGFVVLKLYLSDVWELDHIFRITAFLGLGVLLLLVSYLYSRFRPVIERLWTDDHGA